MTRKNRFTFGALAAIVTITAGSVALWGKASDCMDNRIREVTRMTIDTTLKRDIRDLRVMIQFNKMQARIDSTKWRMWNSAIDIVDHGGKID